MDTAVCQLRYFIQQRLNSAAEEILGEVHKTIVFTLYEAEVSRSKEEIERLRHEVDRLRNKSAAEPSPTIIAVETETERHDAPLLQETPGPSAPEESNLSMGAEPPGPSQVFAKLENNNSKDCLVQTDLTVPEIKEEQKELGDSTQTDPSDFLSTIIAEPSMAGSTVEVGGDYVAPLLQENAGSSTLEESNLSQTQEQDQTEAQTLYEMQPLSSDFSAAESENNDCEEDLSNKKGKRTKTMKRKGKKLQRQSGSENEKDQAALTDDKTSGKTERGQMFCHVCGKGFLYMGFLKKHINAHEKTVDCTLCGKKYQSAEQLNVHMVSHYNATCFCGKTFPNIRCLRMHEKTHARNNCVCQECGMTFSQKEQLAVHVKTHSTVKLHHCNICGKAFRQSETLRHHKRCHSSEKSYCCDLCGKVFVTRSRLQMHIRFHSAEIAYPCDICGKHFSHNGQMIKHRNGHTGDRLRGKSWKHNQ